MAEGEASAKGRKAMEPSQEEEMHMHRYLKGAATLALATSALTIAVPAQAAGSNADFGQHVRTCAQMMGFDGTHNPGMHEGASGWDPSQGCEMP